MHERVKFEDSLITALQVSNVKMLKAGTITIYNTNVIHDKLKHNFDA